jgi:hypothetical protein
MTYVEDYEEWAETTDYPALRTVLAEQYRGLPDEGVEALLESVGLSAEDMEFNLGRALRDVGNAVVSVAPTVLPIAGTAVGSVFGGPVGGMVGGALGNLAGGAIGAAARPQAWPTARPPMRPPMPAGGMPGRPAAVGGSGAAAQLLQMINRPEVLRGLQSLAMGALGSRSIPVGGTAAPPAAFANLLATLAGRAVAEHHELVAESAEQGLPAYLVGESGEAVVDVGDSAERGEHLLRLLESSFPAEALAWAEWDESDESDEDWEWEAYE